MGYWLLDHCRDRIEHVDNEQNKLNYKATDVRKDFYSFMQPILNNHYQGLTALVLYTSMRTNGFILKETELIPHVNHLLRIMRDEGNLRNYISRLNRSLITDSWSIFETCLNAILTHVLEKEELEEFISGRATQRPGKILKPSKHKVASKQIWKKYDKIFELVKESYGRYQQEDRNFLEFFSMLRNGMHNNHIHHGDEYEYNFNGINHHFEDGSGFTTSAIPDYAYYFDVVLELCSIYREMTDKLDYRALIPYPDPNSPMA